MYLSIDHTNLRVGALPTTSSENSGIQEEALCTFVLSALEQKIA
jgi:hypothetical protein